jgi:hypothetical protein
MFVSPAWSAVAYHNSSHFYYKPKPAPANFSLSAAAQVMPLPRFFFGGLEFEFRVQETCLKGLVAQRLPGALPIAGVRYGSNNHDTWWHEESFVGVYLRSLFET